MSGGAPLRGIVGRARSLPRAARGRRDQLAQRIGDHQQRLEVRALELGRHREVEDEHHFLADSELLVEDPGQHALAEHRLRGRDVRPTAS